MEQPLTEHTNNDQRGVFFKERSGETIASLTYSVDQNVMIIDHTEVNTLHEGTSSEGKLVAAGYEFVKKHGYKVNSLCPFTGVVYNNNPMWGDLHI